MKITSKRKIILIITFSYSPATAEGAQVYTEPYDGHVGHEKGYRERLDAESRSEYGNGGYIQEAYRERMARILKAYRKSTESKLQAYRQRTERMQKAYSERTVGA